MNRRCSCKRIGNNPLKPGDEVHEWGKQGLVVHEGINPIALWWDHRGGEWVFKAAEPVSYWHKHRKRPVALDFSKKRRAYGHDED